MAQNNDLFAALDARYFRLLSSVGLSIAAPSTFTAGTFDAGFMQSLLGTSSVKFRLESVRDCYCLFKSNTYGETSFIGHEYLGGALCLGVGGASVAPSSSRSATQALRCFSTGQVECFSGMLAGAGTISLPGLSFWSQPDLGFYSPSARTVNAVVGSSVTAWSANNTGMAIGNQLVVGSTAIQNTHWLQVNANSAGSLASGLQLVNPNASAGSSVKLTLQGNNNSAYNGIVFDNATNAMHIAHSGTGFHLGTGSVLNAGQVVLMTSSGISVVGTVSGSANLNVLFSGVNTAFAAISSPYSNTSNVSMILEHGLSGSFTQLEITGDAFTVSSPATFLSCVPVIPIAYRPASKIWRPMLYQDAGAWKQGRVAVNSSGTVEVYPDTGNWATATTYILSCMVSWSVYARQ